MFFFTADQHYGHTNIIKFCDRPFESIDEMDNELIKKHNEIVSKDDTVIHAGDFSYKSKKDSHSYIKQLNGNHTFLRGSHDRWMNKDIHEIWEKSFPDNIYIVVCHYAMRTWARSHYNSWQLYGHSHGRLDPIGKQWDIGVDNNDFYPVSFDRIKEIMVERPDNPNVIKNQSS